MRPIARRHTRGDAECRGPRPARRRGRLQAAIAGSRRSFSLNTRASRADTAYVTPGTHNPPEAVRVSEVFAALSFALDLTEGQPMGHSLRACLIGMELAERIDLPLADRRDLYYALMLKDVGCSSSSARVFELFGGDERMARESLEQVDWAHYLQAMRYAMAHAAPDASWFQRARRVAALARAGPRVASELVATRSQRAADIISRLGFGAGVAAAVMALEERWDGRGHPRGHKGGEIPILGRILNLAQALEVFALREGARGAIDMARARSGRWFDPVLVTACGTMDRNLEYWRQLDERQLREAVRAREPGDAALIAGPGTLDRIATAFADVVDAKSPYTAAHSTRVTRLAVEIARRLGFDEAQLAEMKRAGLLHDLGKLSVPNSILDKPGPLNAEEWEVVRLHPYYTEMILDHIRGFDALSFMAASHHERLDGGGYWRGLRREQMPLGSQLLAAADRYDALSTARPYRPALPQETVLKILEGDCGVAFGPECLETLVAVVEGEDVAKAA